MVKYLIFTLGWLGLLTSSIAGEDAPCKTIRFAQTAQNILLNPGNKNPKGNLYFIQNVSDQDIWINHSVAQKGVSAGWASLLRNRYWSAIFVTQPNFLINCSKLAGGKTTYLNCVKAIRGCKIQYEAKNVKGNFWVAEDKEYLRVQSIAKSRGFKTK